MVEPQRGTSTADLKKKNSLLDDEIGKEFLSSWKSMSVAEDNAIEFNCETVPKGGKKNFNFEKLDMDFALDGDFDKISSFKVDMSDLDFSSPPKKIGKPKERSENKSIQEKHQGKQDRFTFSFDFNDLDSFDLDSSLKKGEKRSNKCTDAEVADSLPKHRNNQGLTNVAASSDAFEDSNSKKLPASETITSPKFKSLISGSTDLSFMIDIDPSPSAKFGNLNVSVGEATSLEKKITTDTQETNQQSQSTERTGFTGPDAQQTRQNLSGQSISGDDIIQEIVPEVRTEICSSYTEVNSNPGSQNNNCEIGKKSESLISVPTGNNMNESARGDKNTEDASITIGSQKMLHNSKATKENKNSTTKLLSPLHSESRVDKPIPIQEKVTNGIQSKYFKRLQEPESKLHPASTPKKISSFGNKKMDTVPLSSANERRKDSVSNAQIGNQNVVALMSLDRAATKTLSVRESEKSDNGDNTFSLQVHPASKPEKPTISTIPKCINPKFVVSNTTPVRNLKITSVEKIKSSPLEAGKKTSDFSSLKGLRTLTLNHHLPNSTFQREIKSLRHSEGTMESQVITDVKMANSVRTEKQNLVSPSLKRKTPEISNAFPVILYPLKRLSESPSESRKAKETVQRVDKEKVCKNKNLVDSNPNKDVICDHNRSTYDIPRDAHLTDFEAPIVMENDWNVDKANTCMKELEDICNMLKKKHEEAKEVLVRAIVNNNDLLMLNNPIYEEKIRMIQKFATQMMTKELPNQSVAALSYMSFPAKENSLDH